MARYIECEVACAEIDKGDLLVGNNAEFAKEIINRTPAADVVPKSEVEQIFKEIEEAVYNLTDAFLKGKIYELKKKYTEEWK